MSVLSFIIPAYNEEDNIKPMTNRIIKIMNSIDSDYEIIFINDGSNDNTFKEISDLSIDNYRIKGISFSRNFGKEAAVFAGLNLSKGDACIVMDCDLQHPPETVKEMFLKWKEGFEVIEGVKKTRGKESIIYKGFTNLFYGIMSKFTGIDMKNTSDFKLIDRKAVNALLNLNERNTFFRALTFWIGFRSTSVEYTVNERTYGKSKWSLRSLTKYAINSATSFSTFPLQIITIIGSISILFSIVLGIQTLVRFFTGNAAEGFTTVILLILLIGGLIMISLGIIGHYLAKIYEEVKGRPRYIISEHTGNLTDAECRIECPRKL